MKKIIILTIICMICINYVYALDCQYKDEESYNQWVNVFFENNRELNYEVLEVKNFIQGKNSHITAYRKIAQFDVLNNYDEIVNVTVKFILNGVMQEELLIIDPLGFKRITKGYNNIDQTTIQFQINSPENLESKWLSKKFYREVCQKCPRNSDLICVDDGKPADSDERCGSGKRDINGICTSGTRYIIGDGICSTEVNENCAVSPIDCACGNHTYCNTMGVCVDNPNDPPDGMDYCNKIDTFRRIGVKTNNLPCDCDFECVDHYLCISNKCQPNSINPPTGNLYCESVNNFKKTNNLNLGEICDCDFECIDSVCFNNVCQNLISPKITCPSGKSVKRGEEISCNIVGDNTKLNQDLKVTFILEAGHGLSFSESLGCQNIKGSQCIGTYTIADLSNEGVEVKLTALTGGYSDITGKVTFQYKSQSISENVESLEIHKYFCGDGNIDVGETKENCCLDVGVDEYNFFKFYNEKCNDGVYELEFNNKFGLLVFLLFAIIITMFIKIYYNYKIKLTEAKQKQIAKEIEKIKLDISKKEKEIEIDEKLLSKLKYEKETEETLKIIKERISKSKEEISSLRKSEKEEKEKLKHDRQIPFTNKQGYKVIINEDGYEQFPKSIIQPHKQGLLFHRWYAKKNIYYKNKKNYPLHWKEYEVHHIDGNKRNNDLKNLEILTKEEHKKKHNL